MGTYRSGAKASATFNDSARQDAAIPRGAQRSSTHAKPAGVVLVAEGHRLDNRNAVIGPIGKTAHR